MGNDNSRLDESLAGAEMFSVKEMRGKNGTVSEELLSLDQLKRECLQLKEGVSALAEAIDNFFDDDNDDDESSDESLEIKLQGMALQNQRIIKTLARNLEGHSKVFDLERNEQVMHMVKDCVSAVNDYMYMLVTNVRKLRRLLAECGAIPSPRGRKNNGRKSSDWVYDVISDHQDVDAMLVQLVDTMEDREELESDIIEALILWKDMKKLFC